MRTFPKLFRKYRLKAEFETFIEFGNALSEKGYHYEESTFSRWQTGKRIPFNRQLVLKILEIFIERKAIETIEEANIFLASVGLGYLTREESEKCYLQNLTLPFNKYPITRDNFDLGSLFVSKNTVLEFLKKFTTESFIIDYMEKGPNILGILNIVDGFIKKLADTHLTSTDEKIIYELMASSLFIKAKQLIDVKHGSIFLAENNELTRIYASAPALHKVFPRKNGKTMKVYQEQIPTILPGEYIGEIHPELVQLGIGSSLNIPLTHKNKTFGVLSVFSQKGVSFSQNDLMTLGTL